MSIPISQFIPPPPHRPCHFAPLASIRLFSTSVSLFLPCKPVHLYHFSRFHIYALIYHICFFPSDSLLIPGFGSPLAGFETKPEIEKENCCSQERMGW